MESSDDLSVLPKVKLWGGMYLNEINGFWFSTKFVPNIVRAVDEFKPLPSDVILASFPKTGTTWLKSLLFSIIHRSNPKTESLLANHSPHDLVPFLEFQVFASSSSQVRYTADADNVGIFGTHIPYQLLDKVVDSCRVVYITRNPKDTLVSLWHFVNKLKLDHDIDSKPWPLEDAIEKFCSGTVIFGPYYEHAMGYKMASIKKPDKVFFVTYEELMADTKTHVERLAQFLGCPFNEVDKEKETVEKIVKSCSFNTLSNHQVNKSEDLPCWSASSYSGFFRNIDTLTKAKFHAAGFIYGI